MRLVWAIKGCLCLQNPDMLMARHAGRAAVEDKVVGKSGVQFIWLTQGFCSQIHSIRALWASCLCLRA